MAEEKKALATSFRKGDVSPKGGRKSKEVTEALNNHALNGLDLLWKIATDDDHEWHKQFGYKALQELVRAAAPKRKEMSGPEGGPLELSLSNMFYGDSVNEDGTETIEIETTTPVEIEGGNDQQIESRKGLDGTDNTTSADCEEAECVPRSSSSVR